MSQTRTIGTTEDEILKSIDDQVSGADEARQDYLVGIESVLQVRGKMLEREAKRLAQKYPAGDPRIAQASDRLMGNNSVVLFVRDELARGALTPPAPDKEAWIVFGVVRADGKPIPGLTVMLFDDKRNPIEKVDPATTERDGSYRLLFPMHAPEMAAGHPSTLHLEVYRGKAQRVAVDAMTFQPSPGDVAHRDIDVTPRA